MKYLYHAVLWAVLQVFCQQTVSAQIAVETHPATGAITAIRVTDDPERMNWVLRTDGSQYPWVGENYGWGLGYFTESSAGKSTKRVWKTPVRITPDGLEVSYREGSVRVDVKRKFVQGDLVERYTFTNESGEPVSLSGTGICTPFNDNYPNARECMRSRAHAHIWDGGSAAYVNALRMGSYAPHLGLALTEGAVESYDIWERGRDKENSHTRGVIALNPPDVTLSPGGSHSIGWVVFAHGGNEDFYRKLREKGGVTVSCDRYVFEKGETARITFHSKSPVKKLTAALNGIPVASKREGDLRVFEARMDRVGEMRFDIRYDGKQTHLDCLVIDRIDSLIARRTDFIRTRQQLNDPSNLRDGAYMVYDNERHEIYLNNTRNANPVDRDEGAERLGMGVLLAKQYLLTKNPLLKESLMRYARFVRKNLQTPEYVTYSSVDKKGRNRGYNYMWVASFYFQMYRVTGDRQFAVDGYETLQSMFRQFGYGFYAIEIPVRDGLRVTKEAGMETEHQKLKKDFIKTGDIFIANGLDYPAHEVNYEQSIVAPALTFLLQLYQETGIEKYLDEAKRQLPVLEAFNGQQPSFHLNDIAVRHWDGYWFGKRELFGDTFPHYWSTQTANVFYYYAQCTGDESYLRRAENIVKNNLCLFFPDGSASCAYLYPSRIDGKKAAFYDPYANDQDWALVSYLLITKDI